MTVCGIYIIQNEMNTEYKKLCSSETTSQPSAQSMLVLQNTEIIHKRLE